MYARFYVRGDSEYASPAFLVVKPKKAGDSQVDNLLRETSFSFVTEVWMNYFMSLRIILPFDSLLTSVSSITGHD